MRMPDRLKSRDAPSTAAPREHADLRKSSEKSGYSLWTVNELVAYNLRRARLARGFSQDQLAAELQERTGRPWSNATVSAAERSRESQRTRRFDAGELVAFAITLNVPLAYFFLPPLPEEVTDGPASLQFAAGTLEDLGAARDTNGPLIGPDQLLAFVEPPQVDADYARRALNLLRHYIGGRMPSNKPIRPSGKVEPPHLASTIRIMTHALEAILHGTDLTWEDIDAALANHYEGGLSADYASSRTEQPQHPSLPAPPKLGPIEFSRELRGYDRRQVEHYVHRAESEIATLAGEREEAYIQIRRLAGEVESLHRALAEARREPPKGSPEPPS